jgi:hypothetical protein
MSTIRELSAFPDDRTDQKYGQNAHMLAKLGDKRLVNYIHSGI